MLYINDEPLNFSLISAVERGESSEDELNDFEREYLKGVKVIRELLEKNTREDGRKEFVITSGKKVKINQTGLREPVTQTFIPYIVNSDTDMGYKATWRYTESSPSFDRNGALKYRDNGLIFENTLRITPKKIDKAFFLLFKSPFFSIEKKGNVVGYVENDRATAKLVADQNKQESTLKFFIFGDLSPLEGNESKLFKLAKAYGVNRVDFFEKMFHKFTLSNNPDTAEEYLAKVKVQLYDAVISSAADGVPVNKFFDAVKKDLEWVDLRVDVLDALNNGYIRYEKGKGKASFNVGGEEMFICNVPIQKRSGTEYIESIVDAISLNNELKDYLSTLKDDKSKDSKKFDPTEFQFADGEFEQEFDKLKFHEQKKYAKFIGLEVPNNMKGKQLKELVMEKAKESDLV